MTGKHRSHKVIFNEDLLSACLDDFWERVEKNGDCWEWQGSVGKNGYGRMSFGRGVWKNVHRICWLMINGPIPNNLHVLHRCDNRKCVRPSHLFLGTNKDNIADRVSKGRTVTPNTKGERNSQARFTEEDVVQMRLLYKSGKTQSEIAKIYGTWQSVISNIALRKSWAHVPDSNGS